MRDAISRKEPLLAASASASAPEAAPTPGLRLVVGYKIVRAILTSVAALVLLGLAATGKTRELHEAAVVMRDHVTHAWTVALARALVNALSARHVFLAALALFLDGALALVEGWTLHRRLWWGPWLVLVTTGSLLPFEIVLLVRRFKLGRLALLVVNLAICLYLGRRAHARPPPDVPARAPPTPTAHTAAPRQPARGPDSRAR